MMKGIWITTEELWRENDNKEEWKKDTISKIICFFSDPKKKELPIQSLVERQLSWKVKGHTQKKRKKKRNLTNIQARRRWRVTSPVSHKNIKQLQQNDNQCKIILPDWSVNIKRKISQMTESRSWRFYLFNYLFFSSHLFPVQHSPIFHTHTHTITSSTASWGNARL